MGFEVPCGDMRPPPGNHVELEEILHRFAPAHSFNDFVIILDRALRGNRFIVPAVPAEKFAAARLEYGKIRVVTGNVAKARLERRSPFQSLRQFFVGEFLPATLTIAEGVQESRLCDSGVLQLQRNLSGHITGMSGHLCRHLTVEL